MELTINVNVSERLCDAIEILAAAISMSGRRDVPRTQVVGAGNTVPEKDKAALVEKLKENLDLVEVEKPAITRAELQAKAARLMQVEKGKYALDLKGALEQCGAANISSLDESMFEKFNSLMADLWEVAA